MSQTLAEPTTDMEELYRRVTNGGYNSPFERALSQVSLSPAEGDVSSFTGEETTNYLTGICLQSSRASNIVKDGKNPVTTEPMEHYDDVRYYLEAAPDSLGVITDQFKLTGREGDLYLVVEDLEWPEKLASQLDQAGLDYDMAEVREDVGEAYNSYVEMFETYVTEVLDNDLDINVLRTSENQDLIQKGMNKINGFDPTSPDDQVYYMGSQHFCQNLEKEFELNQSLTKVDPIRHFPELFKDGNVAEANHPMQESRLDYYSGDNETRNPLVLSYQGLAPLSSDTNRKDVEADKPINSENIANIERILDDVPVKADKSPAMRLATFFPNRQEQMARIFNATDQFEDRKDELVQEARDSGLEAREIGGFMEDKREQFRAENGERKNAYDELVEALIDDLRKVFKAGGRL